MSTLRNKEFVEAGEAKARKFVDELEPWRSSADLRELSQFWAAPKNEPESSGAEARDDCLEW